MTISFPTYPIGLFLLYQTLREAVAECEQYNPFIC